MQHTLGKRSAVLDGMPRLSGHAGAAVEGANKFWEDPPPPPCGDVAAGRIMGGRDQKSKLRICGLESWRSGGDPLTDLLRSVDGGAEGRVQLAVEGNADGLLVDALRDLRQGLRCAQWTRRSPHPPLDFPPGRFGAHHPLNLFL